MNRTNNTIRNIKWGMLNKFIVLLLPFIIRTVLIKYIGAEYAGLSSLFNSILQVLNIAELGIGVAITFSLYKPLVNKDTKTVRAIMNLYKKIYRIIGSIVLVGGLLLVPFLKIFIKSDLPSDINIYILFAIYLSNTVLSYMLYAYRIVILEANQRNDILSKVNIVLYLLQFFYQMYMIIIVKNYYLYIISMPIITILNNILCSFYAKKLYPYYYCEGELCQEEKSHIRKRVYGLVIQRVCGVTRNSLDSIFISMFLGLNLVAIYNNYYMILLAITGILSVFINSMNSSIGNSVATESVEKNHNDLNKFNFIYMWIAGWCTICLLCMYQPFMDLWLGKNFLLGFSSVILFALYFYGLKMGDILSIYVLGAGLWWEGKYRALFEAILNIVLNIVLGKIFGINGIIVGTLISLILVNFGYGSYIVFKYYFKNQSLPQYFFKHFLYFSVCVIVGTLTYLLTIFVNFDNKFINIAIISLICLIIPNMLFYLIYKKYYLFNESKNFINYIIKNRKIFKRNRGI